MRKQMNKSRPTFRIIIAGSRSFNDYETLKETVNDLLGTFQPVYNVIIVSGGAQGADSLGERYAREYGLPCESISPDWEQYGKAAGPIRNAQMARRSQALVAFWDGESPGTRNMICMARRRGLITRVVRYDKGITNKNFIQNEQHAYKLH